MQAIQVTEREEPEVLKMSDIKPPLPSRGELIIAVEAAGVNYADLMQHRGTYPLQLPLPYVPGMEAVGVLP